MRKVPGEHRFLITFRCFAPSREKGMARSHPSLRDHPISQVVSPVLCFQYPTGSHRAHALVNKNGAQTDPLPKNTESYPNQFALCYKK